MNKYECPRPCVARHPKCHVECPQYALFMEKNEKQKKDRKMEVAVRIYQVDQKNKAIKNKHSSNKKKGVENAWRSWQSE